MTDQELADKIVAVAIARRFDHDDGAVGYGFVPPMHTQIAWAEASDFVRDWRVTGAMMEKCKGVDLVEDILPIAIYDKFNGTEGACPLPRAINEACVEALSKEVTIRE